MLRKSRWLSLAALTAAAVVATLLGTTVSAHAYAVHGKRCSGYVACASLHVDHAQWAVRGASYADGLNVRYQYAMRTSLYHCDSWDGYCALLERTDFKYQKGVTAMSNKTIWRHHGHVPGNCYKSYTDLRRRTNYGEPYVQIDTVLSSQKCF